jgi:hypothetical protein
LTTFSDIPLTEYLAKKSRLGHLRQSISIIHPDSEAFHGKQLMLEKEGKLHKQSYVRLKHVYQIDISKLRVYRWKCKANSLRLDESSYGDLMDTLGLAKEEWEDTNSLLENATRRLRLLALAKSNARQSSEPQPAETTIRVQQPRTPDTFDYYNDQPSWLNSNTNPQSRHDSSFSTPVTPQQSRAYYDRLAAQANNNARHAPPVTPQQRPNSIYNSPTWSNIASIQAQQRSYGTVRPDRYVQTRSSYIPPRPEPEEEGSSWLFVKCVVGFVAAGASYLWWDAKGKKK